MEPMSDTTTTSDATTTTEVGNGKQEAGLTQAEVDRIVKDRIARVEAKYADYNDLKAKAAGAKSVEQKLADLEARHAEAEARALRSEIATRHGISAEDRDLFLTGSDAESLEAQAVRLAQRTVDQKKTGNVARKEGAQKTSGGGDEEMREFTRNLFNRAD